jgi:hypothetical protein
VLLFTAVVVLLIGAAYCMGYEELVSGRGNWRASLLWSCYGVMPWLMLFEYVKRWEWRADAAIALGWLAVMICGTALASVLAEFLADQLVGSRTAPVTLLVMRRLPAIGALILLLVIVRRDQARVSQRSDPNALDIVRIHAPEIRWIAAADNYLELHLSGNVVTVRLTMRQAEAELAPLGYVRIHRSFLVNRKHVVRSHGAGRGNAIVLADGTELPIGKAFGANLAALR